MNEHILAHGLEWLEEKSKPLFVGVALLLYALEIGRIATTSNPLADMTAFFNAALGALAVPFGIILLQEVLELIASIADNNLLSARKQFQIVLLVIVRSFFKSFGKVSSYLERGEFGVPVQEAVVKVLAIIALMFLIYFFRVMAESSFMKVYAKEGAHTNIYKQLIMVILIVIIVVYQLFVLGSFETSQFIELVFTGLIIVEALFLIGSIVHGKFGRVVLESSLIIALIFARFPLFNSNMLSYTLSVMGVGFATVALFLFFRIRKNMDAQARTVPQ